MIFVLMLCSRVFHSVPMFYPIAHLKIVSFFQSTFPTTQLETYLMVQPIKRLLQPQQIQINQQQYNRIPQKKLIRLLTMVLIIKLNELNLF